MTAITLITVPFLNLWSALFTIGTGPASANEFSKSKNNSGNNQPTKENRLINGGKLYGKKGSDFQESKGEYS